MFHGYVSHNQMVEFSRKNPPLICFFWGNTGNRGPIKSQKEERWTEMNIPFWSCFPLMDLFQTHFSTSSILVMWSLRNIQKPLFWVNDRISLTWTFRPSKGMISRTFPIIYGEVAVRSQWGRDQIYPNYSISIQRTQCFLVPSVFVLPLVSMPSAWMMNGAPNLERTRKLWMFSCGSKGLW